MEGNTKIFQIVGYKNSGKTTLVNKIIHYWSRMNGVVGTIKHHGHGGSPQKSIIKDKDSYRHQDAGAVITAIQGEGELLLQNDNNDWTLKQVIQIYQSFLLDLILVEGYKQEKYPKVVLIRSHDDLELLNELLNIKAVVSWIPVNHVPFKTVFHINDTPNFLKWLYEFLNNVNKSKDENFCRD